MLIRYWFRAAGGDLVKTKSPSDCMSTLGGRCCAIEQQKTDLHCSLRCRGNVYSQKCCCPRSHLIKTFYCCFDVGESQRFRASLWMTNPHQPSEESISYMCIRRSSLYTYHVIRDEAEKGEIEVSYILKAKKINK